VPWLGSRKELGIVDPGRIGDGHVQTYPDPTDGSERSARAIAQGVALAAVLDARVTALMATPAIPPIMLEDLAAPVHNEVLEQNAKDYAARSLALQPRRRPQPGFTARQSTSSMSSLGKSSSKPPSRRDAI
jgi:nucleotide-binding universal stress UspA family protein